MTSALPTQQVGGFYRHRYGDAMIIALSDGFLDIGFGYLKTIDEPAAEAIQREVFRTLPVRSSVNAFLVQMPAGRC